MLFVREFRFCGNGWLKGVMVRCSLVWWFCKFILVLVCNNLFSVVC